MARLNWIERVVWSPKCGGCMMVQRKYNEVIDTVSRAVGVGTWVDWSSACEGEYPVRDAKAIADARFYTANIVAERAEHDAKALEERAAMLRHRANRTRNAARDRSADVRNNSKEQSR